MNRPLFYLWNEDNNNFEWLKMGKRVTKCSVNIMAAWTPRVSTKENLQPKGMYTVAEEKGVGPLSGPLKHSWVERRESGLLSDGREWVSTSLAPGGYKGGSWPPKFESMGARV